MCFAHKQLLLRFRLGSSRVDSQGFVCRPVSAVILQTSDEDVVLLWKEMHNVVVN